MRSILMLTAADADAAALWSKLPRSVKVHVATGLAVLSASELSKDRSGQDAEGHERRSRSVRGQAHKRPRK